MPSPTPFPVRLWTRTHEDGSVTVAIVGESDLQLWGPDAAPIVEELHLAMSDRIERSHPRLLERFAAVPPSELQIVEVPDALILYGPRDQDGELPRLPGRFSVVVTPRGAWREVWIPRLDARTWIDGDADPTAAATELVAALIGRLSPVERLSLRYTGPETLQTLEVAATPADLGWFTGPHGPRDTLPEPAPPEPVEELVRPDGKRPPPTPTLDTVAQPLHLLAKADQLPRAYERDAEIARLVDLLAARSGPIVVLGARGVGKSVLLDELARRITAADAPPTFRGRPAFFLDADRLVAGDGGFGDWQRQVLDVLREVAESEATWFLGAVLPLLDAGKSAHSDHHVAQMLGPAFATRELRVIAESTEVGWAQVQLRNPGFAGLFVQVRLDEPAPDVTRRIVDQVADASRLALDSGARAAVLELARRYGRRDSLLGASVGLLRRVVASASVEAPASAIDRFRVVAHVCDETGLPAFLVRDDQPLDRDALRGRFAARILGQPAVVDRMADLIVRIKAGLADDSRPLGAYLFLGPTGVGKTETVKVLAEILYGRSDRILRFDMSEFGGSDALDRLIGTGPTHGLVGRVAQLPFAVVLLDEIEKAHPAVFDLLLQVLGEARLTDRSGRTADFRNTIVLMTSNLGVGTFRRPTGFGSDPHAALRDHLLSEVRRFFRPELVGRLDEVIAFEPLHADSIGRLADRELAAVRLRDGFVGRNVGLELAPDVPQWLADRGVDARYGARPLKRTIERELVAPIARRLSERKESPRAVRVAVGDALSVEPTDDPAAGVVRDEALLDALDRLGHLRYALGRWAEVPVYRDAVHLVRLVDRLADTRAFWRDEAAARARLQQVAEPRAVIETLVGLRDRVDAAEDLALELWWAARPADPTLLDELDGAEATSADLEWTIAGLDRAERDEVTLWFVAEDRSNHDGRSMEPLILAYGTLAERRSWKIRLAVRPTHDAEPPEAIDADVLEHEARRWWVHPHELTTESALQQQLRSRHNVTSVVELRITGRHAATMLADESGRHTLENANGVDDVVVVTWPSASDPAFPRLKLLRRPLPQQRQRQILLRRDRVRDYVLDWQTGVGRLPDRLEGLLRDRMLARMFP